MGETYDTFKRAFNLVEADTPELLKRVFQLRYQVFCEQLELPGFDISNYPEKREKDSYDMRSSHMLIQFIPTGEFVGTVRLILPDPSNPEELFPVEQHTKINPELFKLDVSSRKHTAEISRFLVAPGFDRRKNKERRQSSAQGLRTNFSSTMQQSTANTESIIERRKGERRKGDRRCLNVYMVLMAAVVQMSSSNDIKFWLSAMDPAMNRLLRFIGLDGKPIGPLANFHGLRKPYFGVIDDMLNKLYTQNFEAWEVITDRGNNWKKKQLKISDFLQ